MPTTALLVNLMPKNISIFKLFAYLHTPTHTQTLWCSLFARTTQGLRAAMAVVVVVGWCQRATEAPPSDSGIG